MIKSLQETLDQATTQLSLDEQEALGKVIQENWQSLLSKARSRIQKIKNHQNEKKKSLAPPEPTQAEQILESIQAMGNPPEGCMEYLMDSVKEFRENFEFRHDEESP